MGDSSPFRQGGAWPLVSIGLPVFNGEGMVGAALESLIGQTYEEIEIIICDNRSTDGTPEICREMAGKDPRVSFHTSEVNRGAAWNFNRAFKLARGPLFKWAAHDDLCHPRFIQECVGALMRDPGIVLCHSRSDELDSRGAFLRHLHCPTGVNLERRSQRFGSVVLEWHASIPIFGVIRSQVLRETRLIEGYVGSDWVLLCHLALIGRFHEVPEVLFWRTEHEQTSQNAFDLSERLEWFDTSRAGAIDLPNWRMALELFKTVRRADLTPTERDESFRVLCSYLFERSGGFRRDLFEAAKALLRRSPRGARLVDRLKRFYHSHPSLHRV